MENKREKFEALQEIYFDRHFSGDPDEDTRKSVELFAKAQQNAEDLATKIEDGEAYSETEARLVLQDLFLSYSFKKQMEGGSQ